MTDAWLASLEDEHDRALAKAILDHLREELKQIRFDIGVAERRSNRNASHVHEAHLRIDILSDRQHVIENHFEKGGEIDLMQQALARMATQIEALSNTREQGGDGDG